MSPTTLRRVSACLAVCVLGALALAAHAYADKIQSTQAAPLAAPAAAPANDSYEGRIRWSATFDEAYSERHDVFPLDHEQSTEGATLEPGESASCAPIGATVWFEYYSDRSGTLSLNTEGSDFNTVLAVYSFSGGFIPSPPGGGLQEIACDTSAGGQSFMEVPIQKDVPYLIQVGGRDGAAGNLQVHGRCLGCTVPNDDLDNRQGVSVDAYRSVFTWHQGTDGATREPGEAQPCGNIGATVWLEFYGDFEAAVEIDTAGSDFDTVVSVYREAPDVGFPGENIGCNVGAPGQQARLKVRTTPGRYLLLQAGGKDGASGNLTLTLRCSPYCPPTNDDFARHNEAEPPIDETLNTRGTTVEPGEPEGCANIGGTIWNRVEVWGDARLTITTEGSDFDAVVALYEQPVPAYAPDTGEQLLDGLVEIDCESGTVSNPARLSWNATGLTQYYVQIGGRNGQTGTLRWTLNCDPGPCPPSNDAEERYNGLSAPYSFPYHETVDTRGATEEPGERLDCGNMTNTVWYVVYPNGIDAQLIVDTAGSDYGTAIAVYDANFGPDGENHLLHCASGSDAQRASLQFHLTGTISYYVQIGGRNGADGTLQVRFDCAGICPPANDSMASARSLYPGSMDIINTSGASLEAGEQRPCGNAGKTAWYSLSPRDATKVRITTTGSDFPTVIALYAFEGASPPGGAANIGCTTSGEMEIDLLEGKAYMLQVGGADDGGGMLRIESICAGACPRYDPEAGAPGVPGQSAGGRAGAIGGPDTGSGGYLRTPR